MNQPTPHLFREEALKHYLQGEDGRGLVRVSPPWVWGLFWVFLAAVWAALMASFLGHVEVNGRGRGIVRPSRGIRMLVSQSGGVVKQVDLGSGQSVKAGTLLLQIEAPTIQSQVLEAERQANAVRSDYLELSGRQDLAYAEQAKRIHGRIDHLQDLIASFQASIQLYERKLKAKQALLKEGLISPFEVDDAQEGIAQAQRQLTGGLQSLEQARQEQAALEAHRQDELWQRKEVIRNAESKRDALVIVQGQTSVVAPEDGVIEALLVKPGEVVQAGQVVCKLIPQGEVLHVVAFLAERDRSFVKPGDTAHLELEQLPYSEFGTLRARVVRVNADLASPYEIREALGEDQRLEAPAYRVELEITNANALDVANVKLRSGMLMNVRYTLRRQRLITLVVDPLRRWFR